MQRCILSICKGEHTLHGRKLRVQLVSNEFRRLKKTESFLNVVGRVIVCNVLYFGSETADYETEAAAVERAAVLSE